MRRPVLTLIAIVAFALAAAPATALAASAVSRTGDVVTVTGGDEANSVLLIGDGGGAVVADRSGIVAGPGCESTTVRLPTLIVDDRGLPRDGSEATPAAACGAPATRVEISLGGGDDTLVSLDNDTTPPATPMPPLQVDGGAGNDDLRGSRAADTILGGPGNDEIRGEGGDDIVDGGPGRDDLQGDSILIGRIDPDGRPEASAFGGDRLLARDGEADLLRCGPGDDSVVADAQDSAADRRDCERRDGLNSLGARITRATFANGAARVTAFCSRACEGSVTVVLARATARRIGIGQGFFDVPLNARRVSRSGPGAFTVRIALSAAQRRLVRRAGRVPAKVVFAAGDLAEVRAPDVQRTVVLRG